MQRVATAAKPDSSAVRQLETSQASLQKIVSDGEKDSEVRARTIGQTDKSASDVTDRTQTSAGVRRVQAAYVNLSETGGAFATGTNDTGTASGSIFATAQQGASPRVVRSAYGLASPTTLAAA